MNCKFVIAAAALLPLLFSCNRQEAENPCGDATLQEMEFCAGCASRTMLDGNAVLWQSGDAISIFDGVNNTKFSTSSSGASALFRGRAKVAEIYYAVYPYNREFSLSDGVLSVSIPLSQTACLGGFAPGMNLSVGCTADTQLEMKNVCGYVKFRLTRSDITAVSILAAGGESLAGEFAVSFNADGTPVCSATAHSDRQASMAPGEGCFDAGDYLFCLAPAKLSAGVKFQYSTSDGKLYQKSVSALTAISRRTPAYVGPIDTGGEEIQATLVLDPATRTTLSPGQTSTNIYLDTNCSGVTATLQGATLENVSITKISDANFKLSFTNPSSGPEDFKTATLVFRATGVDDLSVTLRQNGLLALDLSDQSNPYGVPEATDDTERTIAQGGYTFKYAHCKWYKSKYFMFTGVNGGNTYVAFPAISGLTLRELDITYIYYNTSTNKLNGFVTLYGDSTVRLTDKVNNELVTAEEKVKTRHLVLGKEDIQPQENTSYQFWSYQAANSLMTRITLYYE